MKTECPHCGRVNTHHATANPVEPSPGDLSLCWKCGGISVFTEDGIRKPTDEEAAEFDQDPDVKKYRYAIAESIRPSEAVQMVRGE